MCQWEKFETMRNSRSNTLRMYPQCRARFSLLFTIVKRFGNRYNQCQRTDTRWLESLIDGSGPRDVPHTNAMMRNVQVKKTALQEIYKKHLARALKADPIGV
jgi:hypothetical protein